MEPQNLPPERTPRKHIKADKNDIVMWMGLTALSAYFGSSVEKTTNRILNPAIKKIVNALPTHIADQ